MADEARSHNGRNAKHLKNLRCQALNERAQLVLYRVHATIQMLDLAQALFDLVKPERVDDIGMVSVLCEP